jgi:hypothetical protein
MANTTRSRSGSSSKGASKKGASKSSARSKTTRKTTARSAPVQTESGFSSAFSKFASSKVAKPLIFLAVVILIVGIDLLVSWNKYEMFFKILGVEILIAVVIWIVLTLVFSKRAGSDSNSSPVDEV